MNDRRKFLKQTLLAGTSLAVAGSMKSELFAQSTASKPVVIASGNGLEAVNKAMALVKSGSDTLDAVIAGVNIVENDPNDTSVGYGGLPNADGVVELDASVMHGPSYRGGAVASIRNIKNPSKVAKLVMERTKNVLLVGEGALRFAKAHGFKEEDLLTDKAREEWLKWKETHSTNDDWLPAHDYADKKVSALFEPYHRHTGTINCLAINAKGDISGVTTTSGLAYKIPGRVGDSPIFGAGLYVDNEIGAAGSTGLGEANLLNCTSAMIVEYMRQGKTPEQACLQGCQRIVDRNKTGRWLDVNNRPTFNVNFYALNKKGEFGSASIWGELTYAVHVGDKGEIRKSAYLFKR